MHMVQLHFGSTLQGFADSERNNVCVSVLAATEELYFNQNGSYSVVLLEQNNVKIITTMHPYMYIYTHHY